MQPAKIGSPGTLSRAELKEICVSTGPCLTILLPAYHPGAQDLSHGVRLKKLLRELTADLSGWTPAAEIAELMAPLDLLVDDPAMNAGAPATVIFRSPALFRRFQLPGPVTERAVAGARFHITAVLPYLLEAPEIYFLGIGKKGLRLMHCQDGRCQEAPLPEWIPVSTEEATAFDQPDHSLRNRSSAGASTGNMKGVMFSTSSDWEKSDERLFQFFRAVSRGLRTALKGAPLIVAGGENEVAAWRKGSEYPNELEPLASDLRLLSTEAIERLVFDQVRERARMEAARALGQVQEGSEN